MTTTEERPIPADTTAYDTAPPAPPDGSPPTLDRVDAIERELRDYRLSRDTWTVLVFALAALTAVASVVAIGIALRDDGGSAAAPAAGPAITAVLDEYSITLSSSQVAEGASISITNTGTMDHDLAVVGTDRVSSRLAPGETGTLDLSGLEPGSYELYCTLPGHASAGMRTTIVIGGEGEAGAAATAAGHDHSMMSESDGAARDKAMVDSILAFPAATEGRGNQPLAPEVLPDGTKRFELTASIVDWEVAPGQVVQAWAYNGMVPGPRIDLDVGDRVQVEVTNQLPLSTDVHWHGIDVPNGQDGVGPVTQDLIPSGETYTYEFTVTEPAIGMYHAHAHASDAVPNGMFGTLYVGDLPLPAGRSVSGIDIPADLTVAADVPMVVNDAGAIGLSLNGKGFPATEPLVVDQGDWVRVTYFNEGLQVHPMHLHGFEQIVIAKDGEPLDAPYAADTILVAPGERYTVLFHADQPGTWVWHCHILSHVEAAEGMFGMVTAVVVQ